MAVPKQLINSKQQLGRLTVVETVYHEPSGMAVESRYDTQLTSHDKPRVDEYEIGEDAVIVQLGECSEIVIENSLELPTTNPSSDETVAIQERIVEVDDSWLVPPGKTMRGSPSYDYITLRCLKGTARCSVTIFPA